MDPWLEINSELICQSFRRHPAWLLHTWKMGIYPGFLADILQTGQSLSTCTSLHICWSIFWEKRPELSWASHSGTAWGTESWCWYPCCGASPPVQKRVNMAGLRLPPSERPGRVVLWWHIVPAHGTNVECAGDACRNETSKRHKEWPARQDVLSSWRSLLFTGSIYTSSK